MNQPARAPRPATTPLLAGPRYEILPLPTRLPAVLAETAELPAGSVVTVTASPRHGVEATVDAAERLAAQGLRAVPHLAARQVTGRAHLEETLDRLAAAGVHEVFVVGGDASPAGGRYPDGLALLRALAELGRRPARVGVPSYPEGHWAIPDDVLWSDLRAKQEHADYTVTQLCLDPDAVCRFAAECRRRGVALPVVAGVPGVVDRRTLLRVGLRVGVGESLRFIRGNHGLAGGLARPGGFRPDELVGGLATRADAARCALAGLHYYTFNHVTATARWVRRAQRHGAGQGATT